MKAWYAAPVHVLLLALLGSPVAYAADQPTSVLVSALQPGSPEAIALATLLENYLAQEIALDKSLAVMRIEDTRPFEDYSARVYVQGCPPGDILGCSTIIAERGGAEYAVTGTVRSSASGTEVEVDILDVNDSRVVVSFKSELANGDDKVFAQGVARVLAAAIHGEVGAETDIRTSDDDGPVKPDNDAIARQIAQLSKDLGEVTVALSRPNRAIPKTSYTVDDLAEQSNTDAVKPWERLDMSPGEYLRYRNSGFSLLEWRARSAGRQGQLMIAPMFGYANGAMAGSYYGAYATDDSTEVVDAWSAETQQSGSGAWLNAVVGYGITPALDVGVSVGVQTGSFTRDVDDVVVGQPEEPTDPQTFSASRVTLGARVGVGLFPARSIRPRIGGGLDWMHGYSVTQFEQMPDWLTVFPAPSLLVAQVYVGGEARISKNVDFVLQAPVTMTLTGTKPNTFRSGSQDVVTETVPNGPKVIGVGVTAGLQIRLFGKKTEGGIEDIDAI